MSESSKETFAKNVALATLSDRCKNLQSRLTTVEEENVNLRLQLRNQSIGEIDDTTTTTMVSTTRSETDAMREKIRELSRQKVQLSEHIAMVASENRQLWSRLSKLTKESETVGDSPTHLIRSKTFTQNAPNPKLREVLPKEEELDVAGFAIAEPGTDTAEMRKFIEEMGELKAEVVRQQGVLKAAMTGLKGKLVSKICKNCDAKHEVKPEPATEVPFVDVLLSATDKRQAADNRDKMCPMCGKLFKDCIFDEFQEHVESHFLEDTDSDLRSMERFELLSHTVGNF